MNGDRPVEDAHYTETGFPYPATGSYIDFYGGAAQGPLNYAHAGTMHPQVLLHLTFLFFFFFLDCFISPLAGVSMLKICFPSSHLLLDELIIVYPHKSQGDIKMHRVSLLPKT